MELQIRPIIEDLQKKVVGLSTQKEEPRVAILLEDNTVFFVDTEKGQILLPKPKEEKDGGGQLDEMREGNVSEELQGEAANDGQREEESQGPSGEV